MKLYDISIKNRKKEDISGPSLLARLRNDAVMKSKGMWLSYLDDDNEFEINIIISNLYGRDCDDIRENKNLLSARLMYEELKINYFIQSEKNSDDFNDYNQMGFNIFNMMYENRKIIVDYIAKKNG